MNQFDTVAWVTGRKDNIARQVPITVCYYVDGGGKPHGVWACDESGKDITLDIPFAEYDLVWQKAYDDAAKRVRAALEVAAEGER